MKADLNWFINVYDRINQSVVDVNEKIVGYQAGTVSLERLLVTIQLEQLSMQHEILAAIATANTEFPPAAIANPLIPTRKSLIGFKPNVEQQYEAMSTINASELVPKG